MFHVSFPQTWTQNDIVNQFRKYGPIQIRWIDDTSAFIALIHRENASVLMLTYEKPKGVEVSTFSTYRKIHGTEEDVSINRNIYGLPFKFD